MKKILAILLAALTMLTVFASCGKDETSDTNSDTTKASVSTVTSGKLTVATSPDFAPYEFYSVKDDGSYELAGFDIDLAKYVAKYMGLELEIIPMDFDGVLIELASKNVDLGFAGLSPDPTRVDKMDFSDLYYEGGQSFVTVSKNKDLFKTLEDTNDKKYKIGAQNGSIQKDLADKYSSGADVIALTKVTDIIAELIAGTLDGAYIETAVAETYKKNYPELEIVTDVPYDQEGSCVGVSKGNASLMKAVNEAIAAAKADGSMAKFVADATELSSGKIYEGLVD